MRDYETLERRLQKFEFKLYLKKKKKAWQTTWNFNPGKSAGLPAAHTAD
jgi:hypothetical protein